MKRRLDLNQVESAFAAFLQSHGGTIATMDRTFAQRFEAYSFLFVAKRLSASSAASGFVPAGKPLRLKYSPRGKNENYSYFEFQPIAGGPGFELRHNLSVRSAHSRSTSKAAFSLDLAIVEMGSVGVGESIVDNTHLITFFECKNMIPFPELLAGFLGLAGEVLPQALRKTKRARRFEQLGLDVPGLLTGGGEPSTTCYEIWHTVERRKLLVELWFYSPEHDALVQARGRSPVRSRKPAKPPKKRAKRAPPVPRSRKPVVLSKFAIGTDEVPF